MNWDDIIYIAFLGSSIIFGGVYYRVPFGAAKQWVGTAIGLIIVVSVSGYQVAHPLLLCAINLLILKFIDKRWCHVTSMMISFLYLLLFRLSGYFGLPEPPGHTNAVQMMITLKLIGVCFEVHDTWKLKKDIKISEESLSAAHDTYQSNSDTQVAAGAEVPETTELRLRKSTTTQSTSKGGEAAGSAPHYNQLPIAKTPQEQHDDLLLRLKYEGVEPSLLDVVHYACNYCGILTGPYYSYRVYRDMVQGGGGADLASWRWCWRRIRPLPFYAALMLLGDHFFPLKFAESDAIFSDYSILYRLAYMTPVFFVFRMRLYSGFVLSECVCIMAGVGAYPEASKPKSGRGPTDYKALESPEALQDTESYNFETIHNIDEFGSDFSPTVRSGMRCWNMTVQYWLATNVYRRLGGPKPLREALTMLTSAFWHGMYSGYYLSMLTVPFILMVEDYYARLVRKRLSPAWTSAYDWITWFLKMQWFAYLSMAFLLLRVDTTLRYWRSVAYAGHCLILVLHGFAQFVNLIISKAQVKLKKCRETAFGTDTRLRVKSIPELQNMRGQQQLKLEDSVASENKKED